MKKIMALCLWSVFVVGTTHAQINLESIDLDALLGKVLVVKKGYAPKFFSGKTRLPKLDVVQQLLGSKNNPQINRLFRTFKTGRTVYRIAAYGGTAVALYGAAKSIVKNANSETPASELDAARNLLYSGAGSVLSGVLVKLLTKAASYKAVDLFGGVVRKKLEDVLSFDVGYAPQYNGLPGLKAGVKIAL